MSTRAPTLEQLTDRHCWICGPEPGCYVAPGATWPRLLLHERCVAEYERRQAEVMARSYRITSGAAE